MKKKKKKKTTVTDTTCVTNETPLLTSGKPVRTWYLHSLQRLLFIVAIFLSAMVIYQSVVIIEDRNPHYIFDQLINDGETVFAETKLFDDMFRESIAEVIEYAALRSLFEYEGFFDGKKPIDITAYVYRNQAMPETYISATYELMTLLKWASEGFTFSTQVMTPEELKAFFNDLNVTRNRAGKQFYRVSEERRSMDSYQYNVRLRYLDNKYLTVDGRGVEDFVDNVADYISLVDILTTAANDLFIQYERYQELKAVYEGGNSNVLYYLYITDGYYVSSLSNLFSFSTENLFSNYYLKAIYYDPHTLEYITDTGISERLFRYLLEDYKYAFAEEFPIWIRVDTVLYRADDSFRHVNDSYQAFFNIYPDYLIVAAICLALSFLLLIILTRLTGRVKTQLPPESDSNKKKYGYTVKLRRFDHFFTELWIVMFLAVIYVAVYGVAQFVEIFSRPHAYSSLFTNFSWLPYMLAAYMYVVSLFLSLFYYSIVRRIKARSLWTDSILSKFFALLSKIGRKLRSVFAELQRHFVYIHDNSGLFARYFLPFLVIAVVHFVLIIIIVITSYLTPAFAIFSIVLLLTIDVVCGWRIFKAAQARVDIIAGINHISGGELNHKVDTANIYGDNLVLATCVNQIGDSIAAAVEVSIRDERMKADLVTNVTHDIKTPLTSLIAYIDLIRREEIEDEKISGYVDVLEQKAQRLKQLTDDLVEASKISSGTITLKLEKINLTELVNQSLGEFADRITRRNLQVILSGEDDIHIEADSRRMWRIIENLFSNLCKYALPGTRVYIEKIKKGSGHVELVFKNISEQTLTFSTDELTERFVRGDESRSTEGSGLGLSIAKSLTEAQQGEFEINTDGDLFKVILRFTMV
ncbi:MAG: HAMP domain-containing histidine kinase [Lachnospiraceae bacterium]|nr:HAMP domain-containing histidine kinase [Lachnospiraceae bacterium]